ncbi:MAG: hypothetical protein GVY18_04470 [Bacteroidetes bacterium]|jgi:DNA-binding CsgD family transcriptional regulator|nr:hypothetical protein [Bacteroidota bacterium]
MTLRLTSEKQQQMTGLLRTLLAPLDYEETDDWRYEVAMGLAEVFGADRGYFSLPLAETFYIYPQYISPAVLQTYPDHIREYNRRYGLWKRAVALGVHCRKALLKPWWDEIKRGMYMQEFIPAIRGYGSVCASVLLDPNDEPEADTVGQLAVHYDAPQSPSDDERNESMMRLLYPSFAAGLRTFAALRYHQERLGQTLDALNLPALLCNADGRSLHQTPALTHLLELDPEGSTVRDAMLDLAKHFIEGTDGDGDFHETLKSASGTVVQTTVNTYHVNVTFPPTAIGMECGVLVCLRPDHPPPASQRTLEHQFSLTPQQARVALLLAQRNTNREIAETLYISPHTARHHTEQVLRKLGISSRREVRACLKSSCSPKTSHLR